MTHTHTHSTNPCYVHFCPSSPPPVWLRNISPQNTLPTGVFDPAKLFGVTTLDVVRAEAFVAQLLGADPRDVSVPVIGGHAGITILPLLSRAVPPLPPSVDEQQRAALRARIQDAGTEVVQVRGGGEEGAWGGR